MRVPPAELLEPLLDAYAPFGPAPLCPEISIFQSRRVLDLHEAVQAIAPEPYEEVPFWAVPWPAGLALARVILDAPERVRAKAVLDVGAGGGVVAFAAVLAGAASVLTADRDPWALRVTEIAARRQGLSVGTYEGDVTTIAAPERFDVVLAADLFYEEVSTPPLAAWLLALARRGTDLIVADAGRTYFRPEGYQVVATFDAPASEELDNGVTRRSVVYARRGERGG